ncbi:MAG: hypothetical protein JJ878_21315 [Alphaproteobacteria bacterium]|nr:hypothetical protein [Alphaproteobacteria bacterium]
MDEFNLILGGTIQQQNPAWQFWLRLVSQGVITFAGISFAAWYGLKNAKTIFKISQDTRADRFLAALEMEMRENLYRIQPFYTSLHTYLRRLHETDVEPFTPPDKERPFEFKVYEASIEFIGHYPEKVGRAVVEFYTSLDDIGKKALKPTEDKRIMTASPDNFSKNITTAVMQLNRLIHCYKVVLSNVSPETERIRSANQDPTDVLFNELSESERTIALGYSLVRNLNLRSYAIQSEREVIIRIIAAQK